MTENICLRDCVHSQQKKHHEELRGDNKCKRLWQLETDKVRKSLVT